MDAARPSAPHLIAFERLHDLSSIFSPYHLLKRSHAFLPTFPQDIISFCKESGVGLELVPQGRGLQPPTTNKPELWV